MLRRGGFRYRTVGETRVYHEQVIHDDVECGKCRYNLRTLGVTARCPECGFPVLRSYSVFTAGARNVNPITGSAGAFALSRAAFLVLSRILGRNVDAVRFVYSAYQYAVRHLKKEPRALLNDPEVHAPELCRAVVDYALEHFGNRDDATATLRFWRLERSDDVGEVVAGLIEAGLMVPGAKDHPSDFVGLCRFEELLKPA